MGMHTVCVVLRWRSGPAARRDACLVVVVDRLKQKPDPDNAPDASIAVVKVRLSRRVITLQAWCR